MTPVKEFGECLISVGDKDYFFRPSFLAISSIGDPVEIVQTFYDLYNDEAANLIKKAAESYIHSEYDSLPEYVIHYIKSGILSRKAIMAAHTVLSACCEDDVGDLIGWMKPSKSRKRGFRWRQGIMSPQEMVIIAQRLMMHGVIGKENYVSYSATNRTSLPMNSGRRITSLLREITLTSAKKRPRS